jgi:hypothetical protein
MKARPMQDKPKTIKENMPGKKNARQNLFLSQFRLNKMQDTVLDINTTG